MDLFEVFEICGGGEGCEEGCGCGEVCWAWVWVVREG